MRFICKQVFDINKETMMYNCALWGMGCGYNSFILYRGHEKINVVAITDNEDRMYKCVDGIPVVKPYELFDGTVSYDYLVVTVENDRIYKEIVEEILLE